MAQTPKADEVTLGYTQQIAAADLRWLVDRTCLPSTDVVGG